MKKKKSWLGKKRRGESEEILGVSVKNGIPFELLLTVFL